MTTKHARRTLSLITTSLVVAAIGATGAQAAAPPVKLVLTGHITNGFAEALQGVAVDNDPASPEYGDIYVTDYGNVRVQELTAAGMFVAMFGWEVNATKDKEAGATQAEKNICTAKSGDTCQKGVEGTAAEAFVGAQSVAVDPSTGNVYVQDLSNWRVDEYTAEGQFVLMIGREVNETKDKAAGASEAEKNVCAAESKDICTAGVRAVTGGTEHGAFNFPYIGDGDLLAVGGPEDLLYVGDEHRVQEFKTDGTWVREISLTSISAEPGWNVTALALDQETGDVYLVYGNSDGSNVVREFNPEGREAENFQVSLRQPNIHDNLIRGIALDAAGHLAVSVVEGEGAPEDIFTFGVLYDAATGHQVTEFAVPVSGGGVAFSSEGGLYGVTGGDHHEVLAYTPELVGELVTSPAVCNAGVASGTSATLDCTLNGEVNPEGVAETEALFEWGKTESFGEQTSRQKVEALGPVHAVVEGVRPNETLYYRLAGYDHNVQAPEQLTSEKTKVTTGTVAPKVVGTPSASFVSASAAVLFGELNPENANTTYRFQYGACESLAHCATLAETASGESAAYGRIGTAFEASGLQPVTTYRYRLVAVNANGEAAVNEAGSGVLPEGSFTTGVAAVPQAVSGAASAIGATSATISGSVDPDGLGATYSFEAGVYEGAETRYGVVFSGPAGAGSVPVEESFGLTGLQPGTVYAYRIAIHSGYIDNGEATLRGAPVLLTTLGVPTVLTAPTSLAQLAIPNIPFPKVASPGKGKKQAKSKKKKKKKKKKTKTKTKSKRRRGAA